MMRASVRTALAALTVAVAIAIPRVSSAKSSAYGEYIKAARLLGQWRYEEARAQIARIDKKWPKATETIYLKAELGFLGGDYPAALALLDTIKDADADADVGRLKSLVASTLSVTKNFAHRESAGGHFMIYYAPGKDEVIAELAGDVLEKAYERLGKDFAYKPKQKIRVELLTTPKDLTKVSTLTESDIETTGTIALCKYGKLMAVSPRATLFGYPWMDTLVHEYVHYMVSRLSNDEVPVWLHEGLAKFQQSRWRSPPTSKLTTMDEHLLAMALKKRKLIPFKKMHPSMAKLPSAAAASLAFAEVYTMVAYLHKNVGYAGIRQIIAKAKAGKSARRAVAEVLDSRWPKVEKAWKSYLRSRGLRTTKAVAGRARTGRIRFEKGGQKDDNVGVEEVASLTARKYARLGGLLRSRHMSGAAALEYEKALVASPGDLFVSGKLSRTYLELQKYDKAIALAKPVSVADENDAVPATTLGLAYLATGKLDEAARFFEVALRVSPFDPTVRCGLAEIYGSQERDELAKREQFACTRLRQ